jgi:hypothetical protein
MSDAAPSTPAPNTIGVHGFFADEQFDFLTRCMIGYAAQGVMDVGLVFAAIARITDADADSWYAAWHQTADDLRARATASAGAGHSKTAGQLLLAASEAYSQTNAVADRQSDQTLFAPAFAAQTQCWEAFVDASAGHIDRVAVPYEGSTLPGFLFRPDTSGAPRPTLVMTNGSEGSLSGLWAWGASSALSRGWNAFLYDGPGQQTMLFDKGIPFRHDWEAVLTPVVDSLVTRPDVDASALFAYGCSQAGYWVPRALAFEHRFVAAVIDPGVMDVSSSWIANIPAELVALLRAGNKEAFNDAIAVAAADPKLAQTMAARGRPFGKQTAYDTFATVLDYNLRDVVDKIQTPVLITDPDDEQFWPGQSEELYDHLGGERDLARFVRSDGANFHCEPMARADVDHKMFDYFEDRLGRKPS